MPTDETLILRAKRKLMRDLPRDEPEAHRTLQRMAQNRMIGKVLMARLVLSASRGRVQALLRDRNGRRTGTHRDDLGEVAVKLGAVER